MASYELGTGILQILPNAKNFVRKLKQDLRALETDESVKFTIRNIIPQLTKAKFGNDLKNQLRTLEGDASIKFTIRNISPDTRHFRSELKRELKEIQTEQKLNITAKLKSAQFREEIERISKKRYQVRVDAKFSTAQARAAMKAALEGKTVKVDVDAKTAGAEADIKKTARRRTALIDVRVRNLGGVEKQLADIYKRLGNLRFKTPQPDESSQRESEKSTRSHVSRLNNLYRRLRVIDPTQFTRAFTRPVAITAITGAVFGLIGALGGLVAAAAAAATALGALGAVGLIGGLGVVKAFSELKSASEQSSTDLAKDADKIADSQHKVELALRDVRDATKDQASAQKDLARAYSDANRELRDQNRELIDSQLAQEDAAIAVARAKQNLQKVLNDPRSSALDIQEAQLSVRVNQSRLNSAQDNYSDKKQDVGELNKKGVNGSDKVKDAQANVIKANEKLADANYALKDSIRDLKLAMDGSNGPMAKFNTIMAKLSPNARDFVNKIRTLGGAWRQLTQSVQQNLFAGMGDSVIKLAKNQLPELQRGLGDLATFFNGMFKDLFAQIDSQFSTWSGDGTWDKFLSAIKSSFGNFNTFVMSFIRGLVEITISMGPQLSGFFGSLAKFMDLAAGASGRLGGASLQALGRMFIMLGEILVRLEPGLTALISSFGGISDGIAAFVNENKGQINEFFTTLANAMVGLVPAVADLLKIFMSVMKPILEFIAAHPHMVAGIYLATKAFAILIGVLKAVVTIGEAANVLMGVTWVGTFAKFAKAATFAVVGAIRSIAVAFLSLNTIPMVLVFTAVVVAIMLLWKHKDVVIKFFQECLDAGKTFFGGIWDAIKGLKDIFVGVFRFIYNLVTGNFDGLKDSLRQLGRGFEQLGRGIANVFLGIVNVLAAPFRALGRLLEKIPKSVPGSSWMRSWGKSMASVQIKKLAEGGVAGGDEGGIRNGVLYGPGPKGKDSILGLDPATGMPTAVVAPGEYITDAKTTARFGWLLRSLPHFAPGGQVPDPARPDRPVPPIPKNLSPNVGEPWNQVVPPSTAGPVQFQLPNGQVVPGGAQAPKSAPVSDDRGKVYSDRLKEDPWDGLALARLRHAHGQHPLGPGLASYLEQRYPDFPKYDPELSFQEYSDAYDEWRNKHWNYFVGDGRINTPKDPYDKNHGEAPGYGGDFFGPGSIYDVNTSSLHMELPYVGGKRRSTEEVLDDVIRSNFSVSYTPDDDKKIADRREEIKRDQEKKDQESGAVDIPDLSDLGGGDDPATVPDITTSGVGADGTGGTDTTGGSDGSPSGSAAAAVTLSDKERSQLAGASIAESMWRIVKAQFSNAILTSGKGDHDVDNGYHPQGKAIDISTPGDNQATTQPIADWLFKTYHDDIAQMIWGPGPLVYNVHEQGHGGVATITDQAQLRNQVYADSIGGHYDHIHLASEKMWTGKGTNVGAGNDGGTPGDGGNDGGGTNGTGNDSGSSDNPNNGPDVDASWISVDGGAERLGLMLGDAIFPKGSLLNPGTPGEITGLFGTTTPNKKTGTPNWTGAGANPAAGGPVKGTPVSGPTSTPGQPTQDRQAQLDALIKRYPDKKDQLQQIVGLQDQLDAANNPSTTGLTPEEKDAHIADLKGEMQKVYAQYPADQQLLVGAASLKNMANTTPSVAGLPTTSNGGANDLTGLVSGATGGKDPVTLTDGHPGRLWGLPDYKGITPGAAIGRAFGIVAKGALAFFGLENSILSSSNTWNKAMQSGVQEGFRAWGPKFGFTGDSGEKNEGDNAGDGTPGTTKDGMLKAGELTFDPSAPASTQGANRGNAPAATYSGGSKDLHNLVYAQFRNAGYSDADWPTLVTLINKESGWNPEARNPSSDAYGLAQFLTKGNIDKYLGGKNRGVDPGVQAAGMMRYLNDRYGPGAKDNIPGKTAVQSALAFHLKHNWYDEGGWLPTGPSLVMNQTGRPEPVFNPAQWGTLQKVVGYAQWAQQQPNTPQQTAPGQVEQVDKDPQFDPAIGERKPPQIGVGSQGDSAGSGAGGGTGAQGSLSGAITQGLTSYGQQVGNQALSAVTSAASGVGSTAAGAAGAAAGGPAAAVTGPAAAAVQGAMQIGSQLANKFVPKFVGTLGNSLGFTGSESVNLFQSLSKQNLPNAEQQVKGLVQPKAATPAGNRVNDNSTHIESMQVMDAQAFTAQMDQIQTVKNQATLGTAPRV